MLKKIAAILYRWSEVGMLVPGGRDAVTGKSSVPLFFSFVTFVLAVASVIALHFDVKLLIATATSISFWAIATVFFMMRKIDKASINLQKDTLDVQDDTPDQQPPSS